MTRRTEQSASGGKMFRERETCHSFIVHHCKPSEQLIGTDDRPVPLAAWGWQQRRSEGEEL